MKVDPNEQFAPSTEDLQSLSELANELHWAEAQLEKAQEKVRETQAEVLKIAERQIPELMQRIGMQEFTTTNGMKLKVNDVYRASITQARRVEAHAWLDKQGHGDMIKNNVTVAFSRDQGTEAANLLISLEDDGYLVKNDQKVESSTLRKWVKDQMEAGVIIPMDLFGAAKVQRAKITARPDSVFGE